MPLYNAVTLGRATGLLMAGTITILVFFAAQIVLNLQIFQK